MSDLLKTLTQKELLALALEASQRGDSAHAVAYLKEAGARPDARPEALFMLGSEYAQAGLIEDARACMARSIEIAPDYAISRFQLGLLMLTSGDGQSALQTWHPLEDLPPDHPQVYLADFHRGLKHLIADEFEACIQALEQGLARNADIEPLNVDMRRVVTTVRSMQTGERTQPPPPIPSAPTPAPAPTGAEDSSQDAIHLFITAYTQGGKPH